MRTYYIKGLPNSNTYPSNTLVTKILLGTLGCVPAYDRYFIDGMKQSNLPNKKFSPNSIKTLQKFYTDNKIEFDKAVNLNYSYAEAESIATTQSTALNCMFFNILSFSDNAKTPTKANKDTINTLTNA